jgi:hypothetical protein
MLKISLIVVAVLIALLIVVVAMQPGDFRVSRQANVSAPASLVFAQVNDFHKWEAWNPWGKIDPAMKQAYGGAASGTGATYAWEGNNEVGAGRMTITESRPSDLIRIQLEFLKPLAATNTAEFTFAEQGGETAVTWSMQGKNSFLAKAIHLVVDMDRMVGGQFEKGLASMKAVSEQTSAR